MANKQQPIGICDNPDCLAEISRERWYTSKGKPRLYCCRQCRNTGNSRAGAPIRSQKARKRVAAGEWQNPAKLHPPTPEERSRRARLARQREVEAGTWRNPALTAEARRKLSRPRKHGDNPALHRAIEKLGSGCRMADLSEEEAEAYRAYRRELRDSRRDEINAAARRRYHARQSQMSDAERRAQRAR